MKFFAESLKLLYLFTVKWQFFIFYQSLRKMYFVWQNIFHLQKYQVFIFIDVRNMCKEQQSIGKLRLQKRLLHDKQSFENASSSFSVFSFF